MVGLLSFENQVAGIILGIIRLSPSVSNISGGLSASYCTFIAIGNPFSARVHAANSEPRNVSRFWRELSAESTIVGRVTPWL